VKDVSKLAKEVISREYISGIRAVMSGQGIVSQRTNRDALVVFGIIPIPGEKN
jgi:hypothetical protein